MKKLSLETLKKRAEAVASEDLLKTISGGTENACHNRIDVKEFEVKKDKLDIPVPVYY